MIVDKTKGLSLLLPKLVLCYNAGSLVADESYCCDNFDDRVLPTLIELTSVLPNVGVIGRALKTYKEDVLSKKLLFFLPSRNAVDPFALRSEVLEEISAPTPLPCLFPKRSVPVPLRSFKVRVA